MPKQPILLLDLRNPLQEDTPAIPEPLLTAAAELGGRLHYVHTAEGRLGEAVRTASGAISPAGIILLRSATSNLPSAELEKPLAVFDVPAVELFLDDALGMHLRMDQPQAGRIIQRTFYGRKERGLYWAMRFLLHCGDYPYRTIAYGPLDSQIGDLMLPEGSGPFPVVMLVHGGFWRDGYYRDSTHGIAADLARRGFAVWNIEYRRVGPSGGGFPESHRDVLQALNYLQTLAGSHPLDLQRVTVVGHSAGGYLAAWASSIPQGTTAQLMPKPEVLVRLGICLAGVTDLDEAHKEGGGERAATLFLKKAAENEALRRQLSVGYLNFAPETRLILAHGTQDEYVPFALSEHTMEILKERQQQAELLIFPDSGHNEFVDPGSEEWGRIAALVEEELLAKR